MKIKITKTNFAVVEIDVDKNELKKIQEEFVWVIPKHCLNKHSFNVNFSITILYSNESIDSSEAVNKMARFNMLKTPDDTEHTMNLEIKLLLQDIETLFQGNVCVREFPSYKTLDGDEYNFAVVLSHEKTR